MMKYGKRYLLCLALGLFLAQSGCATTSNRAETGTWQQWPQQAEVSETLRAVIDDMAAGHIQKAESALTLAVRSTEPAAAYLYAECAALRGDVPAAEDRFLDLVASFPDSALATPALSRLMMLDETTMSPMDWDKVNALRVTDPYASARLVVLQNRAVNNSPDRSILKHPTATPLVHWHWMGPFSPNIVSALDADMVFDADDVLAPQYEVEGQIRKPFTYAPDYQTPFNAARNGLYVAETQIDLDKDAEVHVIGYSNQLYKLQIDGKPVLSRDVKSIGRNDILSSVVKLDRGSHVIRARVGYTKSSRSKLSFWVQPVSEKDAGSAVITEQTEVSLSSVNAKKVGNVRLYDVSDVVGQKIDPVPSDALRVWLGAATAIASGDVQIAEALLQSRLEKDANDVVAQYLRALRYQADADLEASLRSENAINQFKEIEEAAPELGHAHVLLMLEFVKQKQYKMALDVYKNYRSQIPDNVDTDYLLGEIFGGMDWSEFSAEYARKAASKAPNSCRLANQALDADALHHRYIAFDDLSPKLQSCPAVIHAYAKREGDDAADSKRWQNAILQLSANYPNDVRLKLEAIQITVRSDPAKAIDEMSKYLDGVEAGFYPEPDSELVLGIIDELRVASYERDAQEILGRMAAILPTEETYQNMMLVQNGQKPFESLRIDGDRTIRDYLAQNRDEAGHSVTVLDYAATHIYPNGAKLGLTHIISRVLTKEGKNITGEVYLPKNAAVLKLHTIKSDTFEKIEPETIDFKSSVTAPNLSVGDFVEVEYLTYDPPVSGFTNRAITDMFFYGSDQSPIVRSEYVFEYPSDWNVDIIEGGPKNKIIRNCKPVGDYTRCDAYVEDIPVVLTEPRAPSGFDIIPNIEVYHRYNWDVIQNGIYETVVRQTRQTPYIDRFYSQLDIPKTDSTWEIAKSIYDAVIKAIDESESVSSSDMESATATITRGTGSRVVTLKALYDKAGLNSYFGLVRSVLAPENIEKLPSYYNNGYSTMLIVDTEKGPAYVQPSEDFVPFDYLTPDTQNTEVIPLQPGISTFSTRRDKIEDMRGTIDITYQIAPDGSASAKGVETMKGTRALVMRNFLNTVKNDSTRMHQILQNSLANSYGRISLTRLENEHLEDIYQPLTLNYDFDIASFATVSDDELEILSKIYAYNLVKQFAPIAANERKYPVLIENEVLSNRKLTFHAPDDYKWQSATLQDFSIDSRFGKFSREIHIDGTTLEVNEHIALLPQRVDLKDYAEFREFCLAVDEAQRTVMSAKK